MARVLGCLGDDVHDRAARGPGRAGFEPRRFGQGMGDVQVRQGADELVGFRRRLLVVGENVGQGLAGQ